MIGSPFRRAAIAVAFVSLTAFGIACAGAAGTTGSSVREPEAVVEIPPPAASASAAPIAEVADAGATQEEETQDGPIAPAAQFGMIGIISADGGAPNGIGAPWGAFGSGGLGNMGTLGHGEGFALGGGKPAGASRKPILTPGAINAAGQLPPEVIQRIARQNFGRFRLCYELGLAKDPTLAGHVIVKFVIGKDGSVMSASDGGSDLGDRNVVSCVVRAFGSLAFPAPEGGGVVVVSYPMRFSPGEDDAKKKP